MDPLQQQQQQPMEPQKASLSHKDVASHLLKRFLSLLARNYDNGNCAFLATFDCCPTPLSAVVTRMVCRVAPSVAPVAPTPRASAPGQGSDVFSIRTLYPPSQSFSSHCISIGIRLRDLQLLRSWRREPEGERAAIVTRRCDLK